MAVDLKISQPNFSVYFRFEDGYPEHCSTALCFYLRGT